MVHSRAGLESLAHAYIIFMGARYFRMAYRALDSRRYHQFFYSQIVDSYIGSQAFG